MPLHELDELLKRTMGLDVASIGMSALERAVQERLRACTVDDPERYVDRVRNSADELQALIDAVVVPETWFFRDREVFAALVKFVRDEWLPANPAGCLRLLSLPCSTGEEAYSMAIALLDAHVPAERFRIDAIDICGRSLTHARRGVYGRGSFRGSSLSFRDHHFERVADGHAVSEAVRRQVTFQQGNLLSAGFLPGREVYDVIFCRNMLIYFDCETQNRAVGVLERLMKPKGLLFAGSSESGIFLNLAFSSARIPMAFAFRKGREVKPARSVAAPKLRSQPPRTFVTPISPVEQPTRAQQPPSDQLSGPEEAIRLADQGHFAEASRCCDEFVRRHGPSAAAFYVLGLVRDASGNTEDAANFYRKALYLDPAHQDALVHLALLMEKQGMKSEAETLWNRARRVATRKAQ